MSPTAVIGQVVMDALANLDQVAYVRFASVYRSFKDIEEFMHELEELIERRKQEPEMMRLQGKKGESA